MSLSDIILYKSRDRLLSHDESKHEATRCILAFCYSRLIQYVRETYDCTMDQELADAAA